MKIHIFNDTYYSSQDLQPVANGMYPIYGDGEIIANILSTENSWVIRLANNFRADNAAGDSFAEVKTAGYVELGYTDDAPTVGYAKLAASTAGKVKTVTSGGAEYLVIKVDTTAGTVGFIM